MNINSAKSILSVSNLGVRRSERWLFRDLNFELQQGEIMQVVGQNGAGKTSLLRSLCGLLSHAEGEVAWNTKYHATDTGHVQLPLYLGHLSAVKKELSVLENLQYHPINGQQSKLKPIMSAIEEVGLSSYAYTATRYLSAGQVRRVTLARLLISDTNCWILDEPFTSLDVDGCHWLEQRIQEFSNRSGAVILTSHQPLNLKIKPTILKLDKLGEE